MSMIVGMDVHHQLSRARRESSLVGMPFAKSVTSCLLSIVYRGGTEIRQQSPFLEDIDLLDETIVIRNPSSFIRDVSGWKVSDENGSNKFQFAQGTVIQPKKELYLYCCAKGRDMNNLKEFHIFWTNKDGTNRMKNVLNDGKCFIYGCLKLHHRSTAYNQNITKLLDGDKISLLNECDTVVSTCEKSPGGQPVIVKTIDSDYTPPSEQEQMFKLNIVLCYLRVAAIICMVLCAQSSPIVYLVSALFSVYLDALSRYVIHMSQGVFVVFLHDRMACCFSGTWPSGRAGQTTY